MSSRKPFRLPNQLRVANAGVFYALGLLVIILSLFSELQGRPPFLSANNVSNILDQTALIGIIAIFSTIVLISGNFDLSVGSSAALGAAVCLLLIPVVGVPLAIAIAVLSGAAVGILNGVIVEYVGINAFIVTLGTLTAVRGLVLVLTDGRTITADGAAGAQFETLDQGFWITPNLYAVGGIALLIVGVVRLVIARRARRPIGALSLILAIAGLALTIAALLIPGLIFTLALSPRTVYMFVIALAAGLLLGWTVVGRRLYATGGNGEAARLAGISVRRYRVAALVCNGAAAAFVGVLYASRIGSINPTGLSGYELTALAAAILGGTSLFGGVGSVAKTIAGALILFTLQNGFNILNLGPNWQGLIQGAVLVIAAGIYTVSGRRRKKKPMPMADVTTPLSPDFTRRPEFQDDENTERVPIAP